MLSTAKSWKVLELTQDLHKKAWTRIKRAVQKGMAAGGPPSPEDTELHVAHRQFTRDFKGRAGTRAALTQMLASVTIPAAVEAGVDRDAGKPQQPCSYQSIPIEGAQNRLTSIGLWLPQGWQGRKADTAEQVKESLQQVQLNLLFKKADVFRKILKKQTQTA